MIIFGRLTHLRFRSLPNLINFYPKKEKTATRSASSSAHAQTVLFTDKVAFSALVILFIQSLPNVTDVWDKKLRPAESFRQLGDLTVMSCDKLVNLVQSNMLPQLRNLTWFYLHGCPLMVGGIVNLEIREEETQEAANNTIELFPELRDLSLGGLQNIIKGLCTFKSEEQPVFHAQVAFPKLERLSLNAVGGIALRQLMHTIGETSKKFLTFEECPEISSVVSPHLFRKLRNVDELRMRSCIGVREVFNFDGLRLGKVKVNALGR